MFSNFQMSSHSTYITTCLLAHKGNILQALSTTSKIKTLYILILAHHIT